jgi:hypothetical protein
VRPRVSILDPRFQYVTAACTDLRATFARVREQQARQEAAEAANAALVSGQLQDAYQRQDRIMLSLTNYLRGVK